MPSPGLNLIYSQVTALITRKAKSNVDVKSIFVTGPGHGAPALLACLYLEGTITNFYPQYSLDADGFERVRNQENLNFRSLIIRCSLLKGFHGRAASPLM